MGLVRVSLGLDLPFRIRDLFSHSLGLYGKPVPEKLLDSLSEFIRDRVRHILAKDGMRKDLIEAALKSDSEDAPSWKRRAEALNAIQGTPGFEDAAIAFRRVANIAQQGLQRQEPIQSEPDPSLFQEQAERNLWAEFGDSQSGLEDLLRRKDFQKALNEMMRLKPSVDAFFDSVMVMVDDVQIRQNRLRLMWRMTETFRRIADFSEVTGS